MPVSARLLACLLFGAASIGCNPHPAPADPAHDFGIAAPGDLARPESADMAGQDDDPPPAPIDMALGPDMTTTTDMGPVHVASCTGTLTCAGNHIQSSCEEAGCTFARDVCIGVVAGCFSITDELNCNDQKGCAWDNTKSSCTGTATPCDQVAISDCLLQIGCDEDHFQCSGVPTKRCADFTIPAFCGLEHDCVWQ